MGEQINAVLSMLRRRKLRLMKLRHTLQWYFECDCHCLMQISFSEIIHKAAALKKAVPVA